MNKERTLTLSLIVLAAAISRLLPHPDNIAPITAIALFAGAQFEDKRLAFFIPLAAMLLSDVILGFHSTQWAVYAAFGMVVGLGFSLRKRIRPIPVAVTTLAASSLFFLVSNLGVWISGGLYPLTLEGLSACFVAAIPFFSHTLLGDLFYSALFFGGFMLAERQYPLLASRSFRTA